MIQITVDTRRAVVTNKEVLTVGSAGIEVQFTLSEDWAGLAKVAVFRQGDEGQKVDVVLDSSLTCVVPPEVLTLDSEVVFIGVYGHNGQGTVIIPTIWASAGVVKPGTEPATPASAEPTPAIWAQILNVAQDAEETATEAMSLVESGLQDLTELETSVEAAESSRVAAEQSRVIAEEQRVVTENSRVVAENTRIANENARDNAETARATAEQSRVAAENARASAETARASAEQERVAAEQYREEKYAEYVETVSGYADNASASATAAAGSASNAVTSASEAAASANQASSSAAGAAASESQASRSAASASASASAASTSETNAANSATAAAESATAAQTAQGAAEDAQDAAETAAASVASSAAQIAQNTSDISELSRQISDVESAFVDWANIVNNVQYYGLLAVQGGPGAVPADTPTYLIGYNANSSSANYKRIIYYNGTAWANFEYKTIDDLPINIANQVKIIDLVTFKDKSQNPVLWARDVSKYMMPTANLFNKVDGDILLGHYISGSGYVENADYNVSGYIPVDDATAYSFKVYPSLYGTNANRLQCFDADKNRIGYSTGVITDGINTAIPNSGTKYVRVAVAVADMDSFMFVEGNNYPTTYIPYSVYIFGHESPLYGKKLCCEGDSLMRGSGNDGISFADMIANDYAMTLNKNAVAGATICSGTVDGQGNPKHWISTSMASLDADGDYYIFDGFVNDVNSSTVMGSITYGYTNTLDTTTFCGAFEQCCKTLVTNFSGKKYGYVFVHRIWNMNDTLVNSFIDNMVTILNKWGVPYINLMDEIPSLNLIDTLKSVYTKDGDGWHPNEAGYKKYYCDKIAAWLETL